MAINLLTDFIIWTSQPGDFPICKFITLLKTTESTTQELVEWAVGVKVVSSTVKTVENNHWKVWIRTQ